MKGQDVLFSSAKQDWCTPPFLFNHLHKRYDFQADIAASDENHLVDKYFSAENSALIAQWGNSGEAVFCNPPYDMSNMFVLKALSERDNVRSIFLIPARVDTKLWHDLICPYAFKVTFLKGRLHFYMNGSPAPHPCGMPLMIVDFFGKRTYSDLLPMICNADPKEMEGYEEYREAIKRRNKLGL